MERAAEGLGRKPLARNASEAAFLALGDGARLWLAEAAAAGTTKIRLKMAQPVTLAKLFEAKDVDWRWDTPRSTPASPKPTSPRSWTTTPPAPPAGSGTMPGRTGR